MHPLPIQAIQRIAGSFPRRFDKNTLLRRAILVGACAAGVLAGPRPAEACGGFFCSAANPVNQAAERIIFAKNDDGTIHQVVEILYEGPSEKFAWVLPIPGIPEIGISSKEVFQRLQAATNPSYQLIDSMDGSCRADFGLDGEAALGGGGDLSADDGSSVVVLDQGTVGPFDYEVIQVDPADEDPADVALLWLEDNGYDVSNLGADVLRPYLANGLNLVAFRLSKGETAGSIRPVTIKYEGTIPSIPIRPTAVAANDDMGVLVWVLGDHRAVPTNYKGLELNELLINWIDPGPTYDDVVTAAADEAGGQGFVTEFADPEPALLATRIAPEWEQIETGYFEEVGREVENHVGRYGNHDGFRKAFSDHVSLREGVTFENFAACTDCYFQTTSQDYGDDVQWGSYDPETDPIEQTDVAAFREAIDRDVIQPIVDTAELFRTHAYVTRLYTTMSADEMTLDPTFDFNPDLEPVSNIRTAERTLSCDSSAWKVVFDDGRVLYGEGGTWPLSPEDPEGLPYNQRIVEFQTSGQPRVLTDNGESIDERFQALSLSKSPGGFSDEGGCSFRATGGGASSGWWLMLLSLLGYGGRRAVVRTRANR